MTENLINMILINLGGIFLDPFCLNAFSPLENFKLFLGGKINC